MHKNIGRLREDEFVFAMNGKKAGELSHNLKHLIKEMFGLFDPEEIVTCGLVDHFQKPDFFIEFKGKRKYVSLKSGRSEGIAEDGLKSFIHYLAENGLSERGQETILLYHFGDGTTDGSGTARLDYNELRYSLKDRIPDLNEELNDSVDFILDAVDRYMFQGTWEGNIPADYIYHGDVNYGTVCSREQVMKHLRKKANAGNWNFMDNPHIGPLQFRPHARYIGRDVVLEERRWKVDFWWAHLGADLDYIAERYNG